MISKILFLSCFVASLLLQVETQASGEHGEKDERHHVERFGEEKALIAVDVQRGFKLSPEAIKTIGVEVELINTENPNIPKSSYVSIQDKKGIYILREGFFKFIEVSPQMNLKSGDQVVVKGMGIIAVTDVYSTDESEYSH